MGVLPMNLSMPWSILSANRRWLPPWPLAPKTRWKCAAPISRAAVKSVDTGEGVIILTDMFGGTPSNLAISLLEEGRVEVVAGLNLPMLVKLVRVRKDSNLHKCAAAAQDAGRKYINIASQILGD